MEKKNETEKFSWMHLEKHPSHFGGIWWINFGKEDVCKWTTFVRNLINDHVTSQIASWSFAI